MQIEYYINIWLQRMVIYGSVLYDSTKSWFKKYRYGEQYRTTVTRLFWGGGGGAGVGEGSSYNLEIETRWWNKPRVIPFYLLAS
jgi:hypothetical protein